MNVFAAGYYQSEKDHQKFVACGFLRRRGREHGERHPVQKLEKEKGVPHCSCGGVIKPDVVLYGEPLDDAVVEGAVDAIRNADNLIIGGTSLNVYPAAGLIDFFRGENVVVINRGAPAKDMGGVFFIDGKIGEIFSQI